MSFTISGKRIWLAGHRGMVGAALARRLARENCEVLTVTRDQVDCRDQQAVRLWMSRERPDAVIIAAAKVGGILANSVLPAEFMYDNLMIESNIIHASHQQGVEKLLFLGSSCIYPKFAPQPLHEDSLLTGPLEETNQWYALAKIAGVKLCEAYRLQYKSDFISAMPTNLYGPADNFDLSSSHVLPALMHKLHLAKVSNADKVSVWGSGRPRREFMYVDDLADALVFLLCRYSDAQHINVGTGTDITISDLAQELAEVVGWHGEFAFDPSKPDGTPRKLMDVSRLSALGWQAPTSLGQGIVLTYEWFLEHRDRDLRQIRLSQD